MKIRNAAKLDISDILKLNNLNTPAVSELNASGLEKLIDISLYSWVIESSSEKVVGFCIILSPGADYSSDNYRWVSDRYDDFQYLDRVVISSEYQGQGYGRKIYEHWFTKSSSEPLLLEVNVKPRNEGSIEFHKKMNFTAVGEQDTENGKKRVQYMLRLPV